MADDAVVVLGGDAASLALAGRLALDGHRVTLWPVPSSGATRDTLCDRPLLHLSGVGGERTAKLAAVTDDPFAALTGGDVLLTCAAPHARAVFNDLLLPLLEPRHTLVLMPGSFGSLGYAKWLRDRCRSLSTLVESDTVPFIAHKPAADRVHVTATVNAPGFGVFPSCRTAAAMAVLGRLFPGARTHPHVLSAALSESAPVVRAPALLMNAAAAEGSCAGSALLAAGFTRAVARVAAALDAERLALAASLDLELPPAAEALHAWGLGPHGDLWSTVNGSYALTRTPEPEQVSLDGRAAEDAVLGLRTSTDLADGLGVSMPASRALVTLHDAATAVDRPAARSLDDLGIDGLTSTALTRFLDTGSREQTT